MLMSQIVHDPRARTTTRRHRPGSIVAQAISAQAQTVASTTAPATWLQVAARRLTPHEWRRRLVHMTPGLLAATLPLLPHTDPLGWFSQVFLVVVICAMALFSMTRAKHCERRGQGGWSVSVLSYAVITLGLLLAFPGQPEIGMAVTMIIAFGDGSATMAGLIVRGPKLPWNRHKSWSGLAAFMLCSIPLASFIYWAEARPGVSANVALGCVAPAVVAAALAESLPLRLNDNIRVGATSGLTILLTHAMFVGY
jgi:dolichol kinase